MIFLYDFPRKVKGTLRVIGFDALSSPVGPKTSLALTPNGNKLDNSVMDSSVLYALMMCE